MENITDFENFIDYKRDMLNSLNYKWDILSSLYEARLNPHLQSAYQNWEHSKNWVKFQAECSLSLTGNETEVINLEVETTDEYYYEIHLGTINACCC